MMGFGKWGACDTLDQRGPVSPKDGSGWVKEILCLCECMMECVFLFDFTILYFFYLYYVYLMVVFKNAK